MFCRFCMNQKIQFLIHNKDIQAPNDYYNMANDTYFSWWAENYYARCFGHYRKYMYICSNNPKRTMPM